MNTRHLNTPAEIADLIANASAGGARHLRPVMSGAINLSVPTRVIRMPPLHRLRTRPLCVLIGDDDYAATGPAGWACAAKLRSWAAFAVIHGAGAEEHHYAMAAALTIDTRRLLFVETSSEAAQDWAGFLRQRADLKFMGVLPSDGPHPVMPAKGAVH